MQQALRAVYQQNSIPEPQARRLSPWGMRRGAQVRGPAGA